jgi:hypothetical protein
MLYYLLETMKSGSGKHVAFVALKSPRGPPSSHTKIVACPPHARSYVMVHFAYALKILTSSSKLGILLRFTELMVG